eukprot:TRINITY_DN12686_c0_g1_i7.p1 TRINITY_DN12686_c0_g1~~TRINITY_DN12686_c0_g1_i7.p1  ORF type:complete len:408 (+),score=86.81 TRINITY_DN12686_c0_g1_i7:131-1354(+)
MEVKKTYSKSVILSKYKVLPISASFDKKSASENGVYSEKSIDPISWKMPKLLKDMLIVNVPFGFHRPNPKTTPKVKPDKTNRKEKVMKDKLAVFALVTVFMGLKPEADSWYYATDGGPIEGPLSSLIMDQLWREDKIFMGRTLVYSKDIMFFSKSTRKYNEPVLALEQFVPIGVLLDSNVFKNVKLFDKGLANEELKENTRAVIASKASNQPSNTAGSEIVENIQNDSVPVAEFGVNSKEQSEEKSETEVITEREKSGASKKKKKKRKKSAKKQKEAATTESKKTQEWKEEQEDADDECEDTEPIISNPTQTTSPVVFNSSEEEKKLKAKNSNHTNETPKGLKPEESEDKSKSSKKKSKGGNSKLAKELKKQAEPLKSNNEKQEASTKGDKTKEDRSGKKSKGGNRK